MDNITPFLPLIAAIGVAVITGSYAMWRAKFRSREPLPPTWPEMWERLDKLEKRQNIRDVAFANILRDAANQWPTDHPGPVFNPEDLDALADTIPSKWLHGPQTSPSV